jgi:hypothetical protein
VARQGRKKTVSKRDEEKTERKVCYGSSDNAYGFVATIKEKTSGNNKNNNKRESIVAFAEVQYNNNNNSKREEEEKNE